MPDIIVLLLVCKVWELGVVIINIEFLSSDWLLQEFLPRGHVIMTEGEEIDDKM